MVKAMTAFVTDTNDIKTRLLRKSYADELEMADLERDITRFLPFDQIEPGMKFLLGNDYTSKVIAQHCWRGIRYAGYTDEADLTTVVNMSAMVCFSSELRAFLKVESGGSKQESADEAGRGWDRAVVPVEFEEMMEDYVLRKWTGKVRESKSPKKAFARGRGWKDILADHFRNTRTAYFEFLAFEYEFCDDMLTKRHEMKKYWYLRNHDEGERHTTVPSNHKEKEWYVKDSPGVSSVEDLKTFPVLKKRKEYKTKVGDDIDYEEIKQAAKNYAAATSGLPEFAGEYFDVVASGPPKAGDIEKAFEKDLEKRRGVRDFEDMGLLDEAARSKDKDKSKSKSKSKSRDSSVVSASGTEKSGSQARTAPSSPSKRRTEKSPEASGKSPTKKVRKSATPKPSTSKDN